MKVIEVSTEAHNKMFYSLPLKIYDGDPNWLQPLDKDIKEVFDTQKNKFFRHGSLTRFIVLNDEDQVVGRIAAFINERTAYKEKQPTGGIGFFECINDQNAAFALFDQAKSWLIDHGMKAAMGPINFGETDMWWGLLVDGFSNPYYGMNYNPSYYKNFFETYGFKVKYEQISNKIDVAKGMPEKEIGRAHV